MEIYRQDTRLTFQWETADRTPEAQGLMSRAAVVTRRTYRKAAADTREDRIRVRFPEEKIWTPRLIAWELTRSCNLNCVHCRAAARFGPYPNELTTKESFDFLDDVASFSKPIMILTGGEPMLRDDIWEIAEHSVGLGLRTVMAPCGFLITEETAQRIKDVGIMRVSYSIDGATAESHDNFRREPGAFASVMQAIEMSNKVGLEFQVNTTITKHNLHELEDILNLVIKLGAQAHHPFLLVPTGRGANLKDQEISPEDYEKTLRLVLRYAR